MKRCPKCGATSFCATAHVTQDWVIDKNGTFIRSNNDCVEVTHFPDDDDIWDCNICGFSAAGRVFNMSSEQPLALHLMTVAQLAEYIASKLNYSQIWKSKFPDCDFGIADIVEMKPYSQEELECIHRCGVSGWFGIHSANFGCDSTTLFAVADLYGGGCDQVCRLYDGISVIEAEILLQEAIRNALECCETVQEDTILIVELLDKEATDNA